MAARGVDTPEVDWPASRTRQVFKDVPVNVRLEIEEFASTYVSRGAAPPGAGIQGKAEVP